MWICSGLNGDLQKDMSTPQPPEPVNVTLFGQKGLVFTGVIKLMILRWDHSGFSRQALNPMARVLVRNRGEDTEKPCEAEAETGWGSHNQGRPGASRGWRAEEGPSPEPAEELCPAHTWLGDLASRLERICFWCFKSNCGSLLQQPRETNTPPAYVLWELFPSYWTLLS